MSVFQEKLKSLQDSLERDFREMETYTEGNYMICKEIEEDVIKYEDFGVTKSLEKKQWLEKECID
jgi:hypothetical protein